MLFTHNNTIKCSNISECCLQENSSYDQLFCLCKQFLYLFIDGAVLSYMQKVSKTTAVYLLPTN